MRICWLILTMSVLIAIAGAQTGGDFNLSWWTIDGGGVSFAQGGMMADNSYAILGATVGQADASNPLVGGEFHLTGGFWFKPCFSTYGDIDLSGCVDDADLLNVLFNFGVVGDHFADTNCDGVVDDADLLIVLFNFGNGC